jgi:ABC-type transport system involved in cytochrome c biogenesis permease subunit
MFDYQFFLNAAVLLFLIAGVFFWTAVLAQNKIIYHSGQAFYISSILALLFCMAKRWQVTGHVPLSNTFETLVFFAWLTALGYYLLIKFDRRYLIAGSVSILIVLMLAGVSFFQTDPRPLVPALRSNWLTIHVLFCFLSYAAFALAFILAVLYLFFGKYLKVNLDLLIYRCIVFGFPFLTLGIASGSIWASQAWGSYWSWDPKETWSLITWLVYAAFLHLRLAKNWRGRRSAWLAVLGFGLVVFTYLGVNYLMTSLHSYN